MTSDEAGGPAADLCVLLDQLLQKGVGCSLPGSDGYTRALSIWNVDAVRYPSVIVHCQSSDNVVQALAAAKQHSLPLSVLGGGQDWAGRGLIEAGLVIDLSPMNRVMIDVDARAATIQGGATAMDVCRALEGTGLMAVTGNTADVGMAGLLMGGGYGPLQNRFGLVCDNLLAATVVLADGRTVTTDETKNPDLFWALRGGGGNFGVVVSMRVRLHCVTSLVCATLIFPWSAAADAMRAYASAAETLADGSAIGLAMAVGPDGRDVIVVAPISASDPSAASNAVRQVEAIATPIVSHIENLSQIQFLQKQSTQLPSGRRYCVATKWLDNLSPEIIAILTSAFKTRTSPHSRIILHRFHGYGSHVPPESSAFGMRRPHYTLLIYGVGNEEIGDPDEHRAWASALSLELARFALPGGYANLLVRGQEEQVAAAFGENGPRLRTLKQKFDPAGLFASAIPLPVAVRLDEVR